MADLTPIPIVVPPGVIVTDSPRAAAGRWIGCDKTRFVNGKPQKVGGNVRITTTATNGTPRAVHCWQDYIQNRYAAAGTYSNLYAFDSGFNLTDITPETTSGTLPNGGLLTTSGLVGGSGYTNGTFTNVSIGCEEEYEPGSVNGAATIVVSGGAVTSLTVTAPGEFFVVGRSVTLPISWGGGTGFDSKVATIGPFSTTNSSNIVTVAWTVLDLATQPVVGQPVVFSGAVTFNNVEMNGEFTVASIVDDIHFTVIANTTANATGAGGGNNSSFVFLIPAGVDAGTSGIGWGRGGWGSLGWGAPPSDPNITGVEPRVWSLDHFGDVLLATYNGGTLYSFDPTQAEPWPRAVTTFGGYAMGAPTDFRAMVVTPERFVFALCDEMVVNVSSQGDPTTWTIATTNTAFARTMQGGTKLVSGRVLAPFLTLIWSDSCCFLFQYTGSQFVYNSSLVGNDCGLIAPGAAVTVAGVAYWMGADNFYVYNGTVSPAPLVNEIRKYVFDGIDTDYVYQSHAVFVAKYNEIWFFYTTKGNVNPSAYVIFHINDQCWSVGTGLFYSSAGVTAGRGCGAHFTQGDTSPVMGATDGYFYNHDPLGGIYDDNGQPLTWSLQLAPYAMSNALVNLDIEGIELDFFEQSGNITATVNTYDRMTDIAPMDTDTEIVPDVSAGITDFRVSGRYISLSMSSSDLGNYMRMGRPVAQGRATATRR
jgi:hypothetical protein